MPESSESKRELVGRIFVGLTAGIFGGEMQPDSSDPIYGAPDIIHHDRKHVYESKGSVSSDHHKIRPVQIDHYRNIENCDGFPFDKDTKAFYFLWQHKRRYDQNLSDFSGIDFEEAIVSRINRLLIVSFDIIQAGEKVWDTTGEKSWGTQYMFRVRERKELFENSESSLENFFQLGSSNYTISSFVIPKGTYTYGSKENSQFSLDVPEFTIKKIIHRDYTSPRRLQRKDMIYCKPKDTDSFDNL